MKFYTYLIIIILGFTVTSSPLQAQPYLENFGVTTGEPVNEGYAFIDGSYIEPPYVVSRKGLALFINDLEIKKPRRHPESPVLIDETPLSNLTDEERQKLYRNLEATRNIYESNLRHGYGYFFYEGMHRKETELTMAYSFSYIAQILTSNYSVEAKLSKLKNSNWHLHGDVTMLVNNFSLSDSLSSRLDQKKIDLLRIDEFGAHTEPTVNNGFLFIDGKYIGTPYMIERRGLGIFVNGKMIKKPVDFSFDPPSGDIDPTMPQAITSETSIYDDIITTYFSKKCAYIRKHYSKEEEKAVLENFFQNLPFVTETNISEESPYIINVTTTENITLPMSLHVLRSNRIPTNTDNFLERIEKQCLNLHKDLVGGKCFFLSSKGGKYRLSTNSIAEKLPIMINILSTNEPPEIKKVRVMSAGLTISENHLNQLVENFKPTTQLNQRLEALRQSNSLEQ